MTDDKIIDEVIEDAVDRGLKLGQDHGYISGLRDAVNILWEFGIDENEKKFMVREKMEEAIGEFQKRYGEIK